MGKSPITTRESEIILCTFCTGVNVIKPQIPRVQRTAGAGQLQAVYGVCFPITQMDEGEVTAEFPCFFFFAGKTGGHLFLSLSFSQAHTLKHVKDPVNHLLAKNREMNKSINTRLFLQNSHSAVHTQTRLDSLSLFVSSLWFSCSFFLKKSIAECPVH